MLALLLLSLATPPASVADPLPATGQKPLPINLPSALALAGSTPLDIAVATRRTQAAAAEWDKARALWLPTLHLGGDYFRHDGQLQDIVGTVFTTSRSALMGGVGPSAVFALSDALYAPQATRQELEARRADEQTTRNDVTLSVAQAYFDVQRARGEVAGALEATLRAEDLLARTEKLAPGLVPTLEVHRVRNERNRRRLAVESAYETWQTRSAELARLLRLPATSLVVPTEPPQLSLTLVDPQTPLDALVETGLLHRPELASHRAVVEAAIVRTRQEKMRPLLPSVALRGVGTNPAGTLSTGVFGGGINSRVGDFSMRNSLDVQVTWDLQNLGFGNRALIRRRAAEQEIAHLRLAYVQDQVAAEVVQARARAERAEARKGLAEEALRDAQKTLSASLEGMSQTKRVGDSILLVVRPQEVVAAVTALDQGYRDYYAAVADANRAQFALYRALGQPAEQLLALVPCERPATVRTMPTP